MKEKTKVIVVLGPTAVGKSTLAVELARRFNGEVISADSRQVYSGLNIGTGKITKREMQGVQHHLLDVASPKTVGTKKQFTAEKFRQLGEKAIVDIIARGKVPIICGGTGFYIQALVNGTVFPDVPPNVALRKKLARKTPAQLFAMLAKKDPRRAAEIDRNNPRRLIRALEIVEALGKVPEQADTKKTDLPYQPFFIGLKLPSEILKEKIATRLHARLSHGMIPETKRLHAAGLSYTKMEMLGLEYRSLARFLQKKISREEMETELQHAIWHYARRQNQWFKRDTKIHWYSSTSAKDRRSITAATQKFLE